jgi:hypothetical protein
VTDKTGKKQMNMNANATAGAAGGPPATAGNTRTRTNNGTSNSRNWRGGNWANRQPRANNTTTNAFEGTVEEMNGHVFQCHREAAEKNQFARTVKELDARVGSHFKQRASDIKKMTKFMEDITIDLPEDHEEKASTTIVRIWGKQVDLCVKRKETHDSNKRALFSVLWGPMLQSHAGKDEAGRQPQKP